MRVHVGDRIVLESERVGQPGREGMIEEVLQEDPARVRVCWEDGHTSILTPSAGVAKISSRKADQKGHSAAATARTARRARS
jgi:Domain of unknown function (DUF1918)